ncbi:MAG: hypothetical protein ABI624_00790 [Casimicrobiaceae bacterium]
MAMPLSPSAESNRLQLTSTVPLDPNKPVWVSYELFAASASEKPTGSIVLDASLEGVPTPVADSIVVFSAEELTRTASAGTIGATLEAQIGKRTPEELAEAFGPELYAAFKALNEKTGSMLSGTMVKVYRSPGTTEARLLVSVEKATGMQPVLINITMGQGDLPAKREAPTSGSKFKMEAVIGSAVLFVISLIWLLMRRKK